MSVSHTPRMPLWQKLRQWRDWLDPAECVSCLQPPALLCADCRNALQPNVQVVSRPALNLLAWAGLSYAGPIRAAMRAIKRDGSPELALAFAPVFAALVEASPVGRHAQLMAIPPSRSEALRERGFTPVERIANAAGHTVVQPLRIRHGVSDQRGLNAQERWRNLHGAFEATPEWRGRLRGARVVVVDDVLTTGATLAEMQRALRSHGAHIAGVWALAAVPLPGLPGPHLRREDPNPGRFHLPRTP